MDAKARGRSLRKAGPTLVALAAAWLGLPVAAAHASPMRANATGRGLSAQEFSTFDAGPAIPPRWASFLAGGESTWAARQSPPFTLPVRLALLTLVQGDPTVALASPLVGYFIWRRNLNPARFDRYHPFLGPQLPQGFIPPIPMVPPTVPDIPVDPPLTPPVPFVPPTVPEPPALVVILMGVAGALVLRRRSRPGFS